MAFTRRQGIGALTLAAIILIGLLLNWGRDAWVATHGPTLTGKPLYRRMIENEGDIFKQDVNVSVNDETLGDKAAKREKSDTTKKRHSKRKGKGKQEKGTSSASTAPVRDLSSPDETLN